MFISLSELSNHSCFRYVSLIILDVIILVFDMRLTIVAFYLSLVLALLLSIQAYYNINLDFYMRLLLSLFLSTWRYYSLLLSVWVLSYSCFYVNSNFIIFIVLKNQPYLITFFHFERNLLQGFPNFVKQPHNASSTQGWGTCWPWEVSLFFQKLYKIHITSQSWVCCCPYKIPVWKFKKKLLYSLFSCL